MIPNSVNLGEQSLKKLISTSSYYPSQTHVVKLITSNRKWAQGTQDITWKSPLHFQHKDTGRSITVKKTMINDNRAYDFNINIAGLGSNMRIFILLRPVRRLPHSTRYKQLDDFRNHPALTAESQYPFFLPFILVLMRSIMTRERSRGLVLENSKRSYSGPCW